MIPEIVLPLASYGLTYLLRHTSGPFDIFTRFREFCGVVVVQNTDGLEESLEHKKILGFNVSEWASCFWCLNSWISLILVLWYLLLIGGNPAYMLLMWLYCIGTAGFIYEKTQNL